MRPEIVSLSFYLPFRAIEASRKYGSIKLIQQLFPKRKGRLGTYIINGIRSNVCFFD